MEKKVVLVSRGAAFMVGAIEKNLREAGYEVISSGPTVKELDAYRSMADMIVCYLGDYVDELTDTWIYLKDLCTEHDKLLMLVGNQMEIDTVEEIIPEALVSARFDRPLNVKALVEEADRLITANDEYSRRKSILLVDDDGAFLKIMKGWLAAKYRVTIVTSGAQAMMYIADNTPDLILLDYEMPVTSGPQVLEMIRSETRVGRLPVIFLTSKGDRESVMKVLALKPDGYLLKSLSREELLRSVDEFFEKQKYKLLHENNGL